MKSNELRTATHIQTTNEKGSIISTSPRNKTFEETFSNLSLKSVTSHIHDIIVPTVAGTAAFTLILAASTFSQQRILNVSTGTIPPLPTVLGIATVTVASVASHISAVKAFEIMAPKHNNNDGKNRYSTSLENVSSILNVSDGHTLSHLLRVTACGLIGYKCLGGRFWSISPSSYINLGSFARKSISATESYATTSERKWLHRIGTLDGCHTCGSKMLLSFRKNKFNGDHMPPLSVVKQMNNTWYRKFLGIKVKQRFYPQCVNCSSKQGSILSKAVNQQKANSKVFFKSGKLPLPPAKDLAHFHGFRPRFSHLTGGAIGTLTIYGAEDKDILNRGGGNRKRFLSLQDNLFEIWNDFMRNFTSR